MYNHHFILLRRLHLIEHCFSCYISFHSSLNIPKIQRLHNIDVCQMIGEPKPISVQKITFQKKVIKYRRNTEVSKAVLIIMLLPTNVLNQSICVIPNERKLNMYKQNKIYGEILAVKKEICSLQFWQLVILRK